jgi:BRCT domain type II-containing protein
MILSNHGLLHIIRSVKAIQNNVRSNNYQGTAAAMSARSMESIFVKALDDLTRIAGYIFHLHKVYSMKLKPNSSDEDDSLLVETMKKFMECQTKYINGKHAICFLGDFCHLEVIGGDCIYKNQNGIY